MYSFRELRKLFYMVTIDKNNWEYKSKGYCTSCGRESFFFYSPLLKRALEGIVEKWELSESFKASLLERENYFCCYCSSNFRKRVHAETVYKLLEIGNFRDFVKMVRSGDMVVYETAHYNVFTGKELHNKPNYHVSEYFNDVTWGSMVNGVRNENLENLTFPDNSFDVLINSDVLEHVGNLDNALYEIKRVLKPGGYHLFTLPVDYELKQTVERAKVVDGRIEHLLPPVMHGDSIREEILAFRDFGADVLGYMSRYGMDCQEVRHTLNGKYVTSVYYAQKKR